MTTPLGLCVHACDEEATETCSHGACCKDCQENACPDATKRSQPHPVLAEGCGSCILGIVFAEDGAVIEACGDCAHEAHKLGRAIDAAADDDAAATFVTKGMKALAEVRGLLWPKGDSDAEWTNETIEDVARAVEFLRPKPASTATEEG